MKQILEIGKFNVDPIINEKIKKITNKVNSRKHRNLSWDELNIADENLTRKIIDLAKKYGYEF